jgi:hypothetical protein
MGPNTDLGPEAPTKMARLALTSRQATAQNLREDVGVVVVSVLARVDEVSVPCRVRRREAVSCGRFLRSSSMYARACRSCQSGREYGPPNLIRPV